jgi:hypothetical protein
MILSMSHCILLDQAHIGDQHIPTLVDSILLVYKIMSTSRCVLLYHAHIGNQHIIPSYVDSIHLVLQDDEYVMLQTPRSCPHSRSTHLFLRTTRRWARHVVYSLIIPTMEINSSHPSWIHFVVLHDHEYVTLHTPRSCPHWRSTYPYLSRFDSLSLQDCEHIMLHTPLSCPYWKSTHYTILRRFNSLSTTRWWACHVANSSIMRSLKINTSFPSSIRFP